LKQRKAYLTELAKQRIFITLVEMLKDREKQQKQELKD
jgi:hypothetical protein